MVSFIRFIIVSIAPLAAMVYENIRQVRGRLYKTLNLLKSLSFIVATIPAIVNCPAEIFTAVADPSRDTVAFRRVHLKEEQCLINFYSSNAKPYNVLFTMQEQDVYKVIEMLESNWISKVLEFRARYLKDKQNLAEVAVGYGYRRGGGHKCRLGCLFFVCACAVHSSSQRSRSP